MVVTGASAGIDPELASLVARDGFEVLLVALRAQLLGSLRRVHRPRSGCPYRAGRLSTDAGVDKVLIALSGLRVDGLINNAAIGGFACFAVGRPLEQGFAVIRLNVAALTRQDRPPLF
ncbi:short subunit dehydrogenase [Kribbella orskensis]|uniref:Short subunit dehydrogenase n=1 Tax=Kribbella orskensis TaxID=2512216 RepID=A0ABY2B7H0_9ACTN|nr:MULTISPECIES: SDR family NAD(P)-dependent oxidoreductase [Kribbella]TCN29265.1 short subunit dehydrogenase [Kribbella sp. VKM Ac-2500]TCO09550.1 short subunit dehydrogenase [Kribbella orskensis]